MNPILLTRQQTQTLALSMGLTEANVTSIMESRMRLKMLRKPQLAELYYFLKPLCPEETGFPSYRAELEHAITRCLVAMRTRALERTRPTPTPTRTPNHPKPAIHCANQTCRETDAALLPIACTVPSCSLNACSLFCLDKHNSASHKNETKTCQSCKRRMLLRVACPTCRISLCSYDCIATHNILDHPTRVNQRVPLDQGPTPSTSTVNSPVTKENTKDPEISHFASVILKSLNPNTDVSFLASSSGITLVTTISRKTIESMVSKEGSNLPKIMIIWHLNRPAGTRLSAGAYQLTFSTPDLWSRTESVGYLQNTTRMDITPCIQSHAESIMKHITQDTPLTIKLTLPSDSKSVTSSALLLHQKLSPAESVAKLYESLLGETCLYKEPILRGLPIAPSTPRDLSALQTKAQKLPPVPTKRRQQIDTLDGISVGDTTIMFQCPLSLTRIKHPAKGRKCEHEQAFDAETFLEFNRKKDVWKCIVCSRMIEPKNLTIDLKMLRLLEKYSGADRCILKANGEYVAVDEKTDGEHKPTAGPAVGTVLILDDDEQVVERGGKRRISQVVSLLDSEDEESEGEEGVRKKQRVEYSTLVRVEENGQIVETLVLD